MKVTPKIRRSAKTLGPWRNIYTNKVACELLLRAGYYQRQRLRSDLQVYRSTRLELSELFDLPCYNWNGIGIEAIALEKKEERYLLLGGGEGSVVMHDLEFPKMAIALSKRSRRNSSACGHRKSVRCISWFADDLGLFVTGSRDKTVIVWDTAEFSPICTFSLGVSVQAAKLSVKPLSAVSNIIACGTKEASIRLCDIVSGSKIHVLSGHKGSVNSLAWSPLNDYILVSGSSDKTIRIWDIRRSGNSSCIACLNYYGTPDEINPSKHQLAHDGEVMKVEFLSNGFYLMSSGKDRRLRIWDCGSSIHNALAFKCTFVNISNEISSKSFEIASTIPEDLSKALVFHPLCLQNDASFASFNIHTGKRVQILKDGHFKPISGLVCRERSQEVFSTAGDGLILKWESYPSVDFSRKHDDCSDAWSE